MYMTGQECDYEATQKGHLATHLKSVHRGQKFRWPECDYEATIKDNLARHRKSLHIRQKFKCQECDYEATQKGHLALLPIWNLCTEDKSFSVQSVIMKQHRKVVFLPIWSLCTEDKSFSVQCVHFWPCGNRAWGVTSNLNIQLSKDFVTGVTRMK